MQWWGAKRLVRAWVAALGLVAGLAVGAEPAMVAQAVVPNVYYVQGATALGSAANQNFISNAGFIETADSVVLIDALGSPALAERLVQEIRRITPKPISHVILTHYHADHVYGLQVFKALGTQIVAHEGGRDYLVSDTARLRLQAAQQELAPWVGASTRLVEADRWISGPTRLQVGGVALLLQPMGPSHTPEDLAIYLPAQGVLFAGDVVFRQRIPFVGQADSRHWIASLDTLLALDARVIVPGHGPLSREPRQDLSLTRDYLLFLREAMGRAAHDMEPFDAAYQAVDWSRFAQLPLFQAANRMNAYNTYLLMEREAR